MISAISIIESPTFPELEPALEKLQIENTALTSMRKAIAHLRSEQPDYIFCEFFYGYGNNYAGINISNLDVLLYTLQKGDHATKVIIFVDKTERQYVDQLNDIYPLQAVLIQPVTSQDIIRKIEEC